MRPAFVAAILLAGCEGGRLEPLPASDLGAADLDASNLSTPGAADAHGPRYAKLETLPQSFLPYCTATLSEARLLQIPTTLGAWGDSGLLAPSGSVILLTSDAAALGGVALLTDGTPVRIGSGLLPGADFASRCAPSTPAPGATRAVLMKEASFYATPSLDGAACTFPTGTGLDVFRFAIDASSGLARVSSVQIETHCGFSSAYSRDIVFADLLPY